MGNRQKSQRTKFYEQKQKELISTMRLASKAQQQSRISPASSGIGESDPNQPQLPPDIADITTILEEEFLSYSLNNIKSDLLNRILEGSICVSDPYTNDEDHHQHQQQQQYSHSHHHHHHHNNSHKKNKNNDKQSTTYPPIEVAGNPIPFWTKQVSENHFPLYESAVSSLLESYNKQIQVEQITKRQWEDFCADLEAHSFLKKYKKPHLRNQATTSQYSASSITESIVPSSSLPSSSLASVTSAQYSSPSSNLQSLSFQPSSSSSSSQSSDSKDHSISSSDEIQIRSEIRRFRSFLLASNETFGLFRYVSSVLHTAFLRIYGEHQLPPRLAFASPWALEKHIEIDLIYIVSVFEMLLSKMSEYYSVQSIGSMIASSTGSLEFRESFLNAMRGEMTTLPIVNMLFVMMRSTFDRIRSILSSHAPSKKLFVELSKRKIQEYITKESHQLKHVTTGQPYNQSIGVLMKLQPGFRKNPVSAVKSLKNVFKPTIIREIEEAAAAIRAKQALQQSSLMHMTTVTVATTATAKTAVTTTSSSSQQSKSISLFKEMNDKMEDHVKEKIEGEGKSSSLSEKQSRGDGVVKGGITTTNDICVCGQGAEEMLPIYGYVIIQAETRMNESLFLDLKIFNMIFSEIQEKVPSFSEHILNATNLLQAYLNLLEHYNISRVTTSRK